VFHIRIISGIITGINYLKPRIMNTNEYHQDIEPGKKNTGVWPFFLIIGGFIAILVLIKLFF